jgi:amino acid adenylation domain-containing protein
MRKSAAYVVAWLGVWWAGAACLPVDPDLPSERRRFMLADAGAVLCLDEIGPGGVSIEPAEPAPEELAYIIYTSGTTVAKGVMVAHRGIMNLLLAQIDAFALTSTSRVLWMLSTAFDASVSDLGTALVAGACLYIEPPPRLATELLAVVRDRSITHVDMPPSLLARLQVGEAPACLQTVVVGGEVCPPEVVRRWAGQVRLVNVYGPTEATVCSSLVRCDIRWSRPDIGTPLPNVAYRVVDGELWIGGIGLFLGYRNQPELTASALVREDGESWYRTGDKVRVHSDGLEFLGRLDRQVKVRGRLVRPEEIESRLQAHPAVARAAVTASSSGLTAYVQRVPHVDVGPTDLQAYLAETLPAWMVPRRWHFLSALPATATGKVHLAELPVGRAATSPTEATLVVAWSHALGLDGITADDNFFALGGDSVAVLDMVAAAARAKLIVPVALVYEFPGLARLAACIDAGSAGGVPTDLLRQDATRSLAALTLRSPPETAAVLEPRAILVTGATGWLGRHVVAALHQKVSCPVYGMGRHAELYGDVTMPRFGWDEATWERLASEIDVVYHCAARVHRFEAYAVLRSTNLEGTANVLRFVGVGCPKQVHYASSLSVLLETDCPTGTMDEATRVYGGYAASKWAAECLLADAGVPVSVYRFGLLVGAATDPLSGFIRQVAALGRVPESAWHRAVDMTPVTYAAEAMVALSFAAPPGLYTLANRTSATFGDVVDALRGAGYTISAVSDAEWRAISIDGAVRAALGPGPGSLFAATGVDFDLAATETLVAQCGIARPLPGPALMRNAVPRALAQT